MRYAFIPVLAVLAAQVGVAQPLPDPGPERWKKVVQIDRVAGDAFAFSPDWKLLAGFVPASNIRSDPGDLLRVWDLASGQERSVTVAKRPTGALGFGSLIYSPSYDLFAIGGHLRLPPSYFWEVSTGKQLPSL